VVLVASQSVDINVERIIDPSDRHFALFSISFAIILKNNSRQKVEALCECKIDAVLCNVAAPLRLG
jgi:hypothetical protein